MEFLIVWLVFSIIVAAVAGGRGRSGFGWFLLSLVISPLLALIAVLAFDRKDIDPQAAAFAAAEGRITPETHHRCPECRELIRKDARKCKHCGSSLQPQ